MVDVRGPARDALGDRHAFLRRLVRKHRAGHRVSDRPDAFRGGASVLVDDDAAMLVDVDAGCGQVETLGVGVAAHRDHEPVELLLVLSAGVLAGDGHAERVRARAGHPSAEPDVEPLPLE